jgi:hypothetical protein
MARINSYPTLKNPTTNDLLVATDVSETGNPTKSLSIADLSELIAPAAGGATSLNGLSDVLIDGTSAYFITIPAGLAGNPGGNVTLGFNAGSSLTTGNSNALYGNAAGDALTTGFSNSAFGDNALGAMNTGDYSVAVGDSALLKLTGDNSFNTAVGYEAGYELVSGVSNTLVGHDAGYGGTAASFSNVVAIGDEAGKSLTTANDVVAIGRRAFNSINTQASGVAVGFEAGRYAYGINNTYLGFKSGLGSNTATNNTATNNVGVGFESLKAVTTGGTNVAIGTLAGSGITTGADNVAIGANASTGSLTGSRNTFIGSGAGNLHDGNDAIGIGVFALNNDDSGSTSSNLAIGNYVGENLQNSTGGNVMIGHKVMRAAQGSYDNTVIGYEAGLVITSGHSNSILGHEAGKAMTTANELIAVGTRAFNSINTQSSGVAVGHEAGRYAYGVNNTYVGYKSGLGSTIPTNNTATSNAGLGYESLKEIKTGSSNVALGAQAAKVVTTGGNNVMLGAQAGSTLVSGNNNVLIGQNAQSGTNPNNEIVIGKDAVGHGTNIAVIGNTSISSIEPGQASGITTLGSSGFPFGNAHIKGIYHDTSGDAGTAGQVLSSTATGTNWIAQTAATSLNGLTDVLVQGNSYYIGKVPASLSGAPNSNTTIGIAGAALTTGDRNILVGNGAGSLITTGASNVAIGAGALAVQVGGDKNVAIGGSALLNQISGIQNTAVGDQAGDAITTGDANTLIGGETGGSLTTGIRNTFIGGQTGGTVVSGNSNIHLGYSLNASGTAATNEIVIGTGMTGLGDNTVSLGTAATTLISGRNNGSIDLGSSSAKFKDVYLNTGRVLTGNMSAPPANATAAGTIGDILFTTTHIYVCTATNTWKRVAIATF